jgi:hypothetical protein
MKKKEIILYERKRIFARGIITNHQRPPKRKKEKQEHKTKYTPNPEPNLQTHATKTLIYAISSSSSQASP